MEKLISVIIPAYNEEGYIRSCLKSVFSQSLPRSQYEVIVVDNASTDKTAEIAKKLGTKVVREGKKGYVHALRKGVVAAKCKLLAFTDADSKVPPKWLEKILDNFRDPKVVGVSGPIVLYDAKFPLKHTHFIIQYLATTLRGPNMAIRKAALNKVGSFNLNVSLSADYIIYKKLKKEGIIKIDRSNIVETSGRRYFHDFPSLLSYVANVFSFELFKKPIISDFSDVRPKNEKAYLYEK